MADHVVRQVRDAVAARLNNLATTSTRVHDFRVDPLMDDELPALIVYDVSDSNGEGTIHSPPLVDRSIEFLVVGLAATSGSVKATLDTIRKEVEAALGTAITVGSKSVQLFYAGSDFNAERGEQQAGRVDMRFTARIFNLMTTPDVLT